MTNEEAIKILEEGEVSKEIGFFVAYQMAIEALEQTQWIPCSVRLPSEDGAYLCWEWLGFCYIDSFKNGKWFLNDTSGAKCVAWLPLPKRYEEGKR